MTLYIVSGFSKAVEFGVAVPKEPVVKAFAYRIPSLEHPDSFAEDLLQGGIPGLSNYRDGIAFAILILVLLFRPAGLLGKQQTEKV